MSRDETGLVSPTLFFGLVSKHGTERNIANAHDVLRTGVELIVHHDAALRVDLDANGFEV
jgi:hypothetical protein